MLHPIILTSYFFFWYLMVFAVCGFFIFSLDDLLIDAIYWLRNFFRKIKYRKSPKLTYEKLASCQEKHIAIMVACWQEAGVIGVMLKHNALSIDYQNYKIFVGLYPNDQETVKEVQAVSQEFPVIVPIIGKDNGPSNKAYNLNSIYHFIKEYEVEHQLSFSCYVFHDSEDVIHPLSLKLYNYLLPKCDMIQIPVLPLETPYLNFTHWVYADEFAENHTKNMIVREALKGFVPSAGVGTAFSDELLTFLAEKQGGSPFSTSSLTEDYRVSLAIKLYKYRQLFATQSIYRTVWQKKFILFGPYQAKKKKELIATRELFPESYRASVIQKSRWIIGISLQEWQNSQWRGDYIIKFLLFHDRKALFAHLINGLGYLIFAYWLIYSSLIIGYPEYPTLQEKLDQSPWVWWMIVFSTMVMINRLSQRSIAVYKIYGLIPALLVFPRAVYGNILNLHSVLRAYQNFFFTVVKKESKRKWDKTLHTFRGAHPLLPYKRRLGDLLIEENIIDAPKLSKLLNENQKTGVQLGELLIQRNLISPITLNKLLARQHKLETIYKQEIKPLDNFNLVPLSRKQRRFLKKEHALVVELDAERKEILFGIYDPSNINLLFELKKLFKNYTINYLMIIEKNPSCCAQEGH